MPKRLLLISTFFCILVFIGYRNIASSLDQPLQRAGLWQVPHGSSLQAVMRYLQPELSEHYLRAQRLLLRWQEKNLAIRAGEYRLQSTMSLHEVIDMLAQGDVVTYNVTFIEGWTATDVKNYLMAQPEFVNDIDITVGLNALHIDPQSEHENPEGWFAPDTYHFSRDSLHSEILKQAHQRMHQWLESAWQQRHDNLPLASPYELLILASIVEKETSLVSERGKIASVFINRLRKGMRLQTDPTVIYGLGTRFDGDLKRADLRSDTPYNTYRIDGLPPTPIALPSRDALFAVALAPETPYLYFVAKGDGSSYFSTTLEEHQNAVRRFQINRRADYRSRPKEGTTHER